MSTWVTVQNTSRIAVQISGDVIGGADIDTVKNEAGEIDGSVDLGNGENTSRIAVRSAGM